MTFLRKLGQVSLVSASTALNSPLTAEVTLLYDGQPVTHLPSTVSFLADKDHIEWYVHI